MASAESVELPRDRKGRTLYINDEVLVGRDAQGGATSLTLAMLCPAIWSVGLCMGAVGDRRYRTSCGGFDPHGLERIEVESDGTD